MTTARPKRGRSKALIKCTILPIVEKKGIHVRLNLWQSQGMKTQPLIELAGLISRHVQVSGSPLEGLPSVVLGIERAPTPPCPYVSDPVFSLIASGRKQIEYGDHMITYGPGQGMVVSIELPMNARVIEATQDEPFLGFGLRLQPQLVAGLLLEHASQAPPEPISGLAVAEASDALVDAVLRLLRLLDFPSDIPVLAPAIEREIIWRLLSTPQGHALRAIGLADSGSTKISRAIRWLRGHFAEAVEVKTLANIAGMSETSFHRHFRSVTSMTPIQFQKQLRLHEARARLVAAAGDVAQIAFAVGYDSPSQFSREYRRQYGRPPGADGRELRAEGGLSAAIP